MGGGPLKQGGGPRRGGQLLGGFLVAVQKVQVLLRPMEVGWALLHVVEQCACVW